MRSVNAFVPQIWKATHSFGSFEDDATHTFFLSGSWKYSSDWRRDRGGGATHSSAAITRM